jgi:hypothetical protein
VLGVERKRRPSCGFCGDAPGTLTIFSRTDPLPGWNGRAISFFPGRNDRAK